ncbi:MAG: efflux RND transporter permease subunit [Armatimonadetes bacterium]|nr:efflux RND transporter permease subunit [Armatimonadota bacterium]
MKNDRGGFNIIRWSVDHAYVVISFYIAMLVLGVLAIGFHMPRRFMPYVESPLLGIITQMAGLSAEEMETYFSTPIEQRMTNIEHVRFIRSVSQDGFSMVVLEFQYGADMMQAQSDVQSLLFKIQGDLPETGANLKPSWILQIDPLNTPVLKLCLTGDEEMGWDLARLREFADNDVINRFKAASRQVYSVSPYGGYRQQMQVRVDRERLYAYGLSILDVRDAIDQYNVAKPAGRLTNETSEPIIRVESLADSSDTVASYPIRVVGDKVVRVGDVSEVMDTFIEPRSAFRHLVYDPETGAEVHQGIEINVLQSGDASSPKTIALLMDVVEELEEENPGIKFEVAYSNADYVNVLFENMYHELILAVILTGLLVLFFLGEIRSTIIALTAIPISMAMALLGMEPLGLSLNSSTLIGLLIAIGRLVDDAIIDVHAVERHLRMGKDVKTATIDGVSEVYRAVFAGTIVLIIALLPLLMSGGITQLMFEGINWPIIFGLSASFLVSITLTPVMCSLYMRRPEERKANWFRTALLAPVDGWLTRLEHAYERLIRWLLKNRFATLTGVGAMLVMGAVFYYFIGSEMMPLGDVGAGSLQMEMRPGTSYKATEKAVKQLEQIMLEEGGDKGWITNAAIEIGVEGGPGMTGGAYFTGYGMKFVNGATAMITYSDKDTGRDNVWSIMDTIQRRALAEIPGIRRLQLKEMGSDVMATALAPVAVIVYGKDLEMLHRMGQEVLKIAEEKVINPRTGKPDIAQPFVSWEMTKPSYTLVIDHEKAARHGLTPTGIAMQAYYALQGGYTKEFYRLGSKRPTTIQVRYQEDQHRDINDLEGMFIAGTGGEQVSLLELVRLEERFAPTMIEHDQMRRIVSIGGYYRMDGRPSMDLTMDLMMRAQADLNWPPGYGIEARGDMTEMMDSFRVILIGLGIALVLMYLILVAQFGGFLQPLQMMFSLPLELAGVFAMLWLMHQAFSTVSLLGVIVLSGMDIVTAILLIDLIVRYRASGIPRNEAVATAAPQRLRPILMTSAITIFVMSQIAFSPKTGLDAYQPLGSVIVGGLVMGTVLSLLVIPVMHTLMDDISRWLQVKILKVDPATLPPVEVESDENV